VKGPVHTSSGPGSPGSGDDRPSAADVGDRHRRLIALALVALSLMFATSAATFLAAPAIQPALEFGVKALAVLTIGMVLPVFIWKARNLRATEWALYEGTEGFVADALARARNVSWVATFVLLVVLTFVTEDRERPPAEFWIQVVLAVMLLSFSAVFLYRTRGADEEAEGDITGA